MKKLLAALLLVAAIAALIWWWVGVNTATQQALPEPVRAAEPLPPGEPDYPIPAPPDLPEDVPPEDERFEPDQPGADAELPAGEEDAATANGEAAALPPLPTLDRSDGRARVELGALADGQGALLAALLVNDELIRKVVVTVDNLDSTPIAPRFRPAVPVPGEFAANPLARGRYTVARANADRYAAFVDAALAVEPHQMARLYIRFYPLFQQAYVDLGYPDRYFNDRLVAIIDHLLSAPRIDRTVALVQPKVFYEYADESLEAQSWGRKTLLRYEQAAGADAADRVLDYLRNVRSIIASGASE